MASSIWISDLNHWNIFVCGWKEKSNIDNSILITSAVAPLTDAATHVSLTSITQRFHGSDPRGSSYWHTLSSPGLLGECTVPRKVAVDLGKEVSVPRGLSFMGLARWATSQSQPYSCSCRLSAEAALPQTQHHGCISSLSSLRSCFPASVLEKVIWQGSLSVSQPHLRLPVRMNSS